jgi:hypothetical protein
MTGGDSDDDDTESSDDDVVDQTVEYMQQVLVNVGRVVIYSDLRFFQQ